MYTALKIISFLLFFFQYLQNVGNLKEKKKPKSKKKKLKTGRKALSKVGKRDVKIQKLFFFFCSGRVYVCFFVFFATLRNNIYVPASKIAETTVFTDTSIV